MRLLHEYENLIVIGYENVISRNIMGGIFRLTQQKTEERIYMLAALQFIVRNLLILSTIIGITFMVVCTVFVIVCVVHGDIKINIVKSNAEKGNL